MRLTTGLQAEESGLAIAAGTEVEIMLTMQFDNEDDSMNTKIGIESIQTALGLTTILIVIMQLAVGKVLKLSLPLYYTL